MRDAASLVLSARLQGEGAEVGAYDPVAEAKAATSAAGGGDGATRRSAALEGADAAVLVTEWPEFAELDWEAAAEAMATPLLIDGRNFLDPERLRKAGFVYEGIGRADRAGSSTMQALVLVGGEGTRLRPLTADRAEAGGAARRPAVHRLHGRVARRPRRRRGDPRLRLPPDALREALGEGPPGGTADALRDRARAARHRGGDPVRGGRAARASASWC